MKYFLSAFLLSFLSFGASNALASDAMTTRNVNLRTGPSVSYHTQATLPAGYPINIQTCRARWCLVNAGGYQGWVVERYISYNAIQTPLRPHVQRRGATSPVIIGGYGNYHGNGHYYNRQTPHATIQPPYGYHRMPSHPHAR